MAAKPLLVFDGNCQAQHLAAMIESTGVAETAYVGPDWGFLPAYQGRICRVLRREEEPEVFAAAKAAGRRLIQVSQLSPFSKQARAQKPIESADKRVLFPELRLWAISPKRFAESFKSGFDVKRIYEIDLQAMRHAQEKTLFPVDLPAFVEREMPNRPLFHTVNHPVGAVFSRLLEGLAVLLAHEIDGNCILAVAADVEDREGLNFETDHPVSRELREELGFNWPAAYAVYERMLLAAQDKHWDELERGRGEFESLFSEDTQFWRCCALLGMARNDSAVAEPAFERLLELCPGVRAPWLLYAQFLRADRRDSDAAALLERAERFFDDCGIWHGIAARIHLMFGARRDAEEHARKHWAASSDNISSAFPLIEVLLQQQKGEEARVLVASLAGRHPIEVNNLRRFLERKKNATGLASALDSQAVSS